MIRFVVVSSRIFDWPCSRNDMSGGRFRPANIFRTSFDASSSACPGATSDVIMHGELPVRSLQRARPESALDPRDVVDPDRPGGRRHGQPADLLRVAPLILEDADLDRVLLLPFLVERDPVVAGHGQPQRVADRRHPHAEIGGAPAIDRDVNLRVRDAQAHLRIGEARQSLRRLERLQRVVGQLLQVGTQDVGRDREAALPFAAAQRVARR